MTDQHIGDQRAPEAPEARLEFAQAIQGHRKMAGGLATLLSGEIAGQDLIKFVWDSVVDVLTWSGGLTLDPMPEHIAASIFGLFAAFAFYQIEEKA